MNVLRSSLLIATATVLLVGCSSLKQKICTEDQQGSSSSAANTEGPGRPSILFLSRNPANPNRNRVFFRDLQVAAKETGVFLSMVSDPQPMPVGVFEDSSGKWKQTGIIDVPLVSNAESGLILAKDGTPPMYQPLGSHDDMLRAASTYLGVDLAKAMPWRLVLVMLDGSADVEKQYTEVSTLLQERNIYVHSWRTGDTTPLVFPSESNKVGTIDPKEVTDSTTGWIFAEKGRQPMYVAAGPYADTVRAMSTYFNMEFQTLKSRSGARERGADGTAPKLKGPGVSGLDLTKFKGKGKKNGGGARGKRKAAQE